MRVDPKKSSEYTKREWLGVVGVFAILFLVVLVVSSVMEVQQEGIDEAWQRDCDDHFNSTEWERKELDNKTEICCLERECYTPQVFGLGNS